MEEWKTIDGYSNYMVSNLGRVKSLNFRGNTGKEELRKPVINPNGYLVIFLSNVGKQKGFMIHRLVYEAFVGKIPKGKQVNHINEDKTDNRLENLNLMTPRENINWGTGIQRRADKLKGKKLSDEHRKHLIEAKAREKRSKPVLQIDKNTNEIIKEWNCAEEVKRLLGYSHSHIRECCLGIRKSAYGFKWENK